MLKLFLAMALFCGTAIADDGNMGNGGYTGCTGTNPPPSCSGGGGFAEEPGTVIGAPAEDSDILIIFEEIGRYILKMI